MQIQSRITATGPLNDSTMYYQNSSLSKLGKNSRKDISLENNAISSHLSSTSKNPKTGNPFFNQQQQQQQENTVFFRPSFGPNEISVQFHEYDDKPHVQNNLSNRPTTSDLLRINQNLNTSSTGIINNTSICLSKADENLRNPFQNLGDKTPTGAKKSGLIVQSNNMNPVSSSPYSPYSPNPNFHAPICCNYNAHPITPIKTTYTIRTPIGIGHNMMNPWSQGNNMLPPPSYSNTNSNNNLHQQSSWYTPTKSMNNMFRDNNGYEPFPRDITHSIGILNKADETLIKSSILRSTINSTPFKGSSDKNNCFQLSNNKISIPNIAPHYAFCNNNNNSLNIDHDYPGKLHDLTIQANETLKKSYNANSGVKSRISPGTLNTESFYAERYSPPVLVANFDNMSRTPVKSTQNKSRHDLNENWYNGSRQNFFENPNQYVKQSPISRLNTRNISPIKSIQDTKDLMNIADQVLRSSTKNRITVSTPNLLKTNNGMNKTNGHNNESDIKQKEEKAKDMEAINEICKPSSQTVSNNTNTMIYNPREPSFSNNQFNNSLTNCYNTSHTFNPQTSIGSNGFGSKINTLCNNIKINRLSSQSDRYTDENFDSENLENINCSADMKICEDNQKSKIQQHNDAKRSEECRKDGNQVLKLETMTKKQLDSKTASLQHCNNPNNHQDIINSKPIETNPNICNNNTITSTQLHGMGNCTLNQSKNNNNNNNQDKSKNLLFTESSQNKKKENLVDSQESKTPSKDKLNQFVLNSNVNNSNKKKQLSTYEQILAKRIKCQSKHNTNSQNQTKLCSSSQDNTENFKENDINNNIKKGIVRVGVATAMSVNGKKSTIIDELYEDGGRYIGEKFGDYKQGHGQYFNLDGTYYDGEWESDQRCGYGILYDKNGDIIYDGEWLQDKFHGNGILYNVNIQLENEDIISIDYTNFDNLGNNWIKYEGEFWNGKKSGTGCLYFDKNCKFSGEFKNDLIHGLGIFYFGNEKGISGNWENNHFLTNE